MKKFWLWLYRYSAKRLTIAELEATLPESDEYDNLVIPTVSLRISMPSGAAAPAAGAVVMSV